MRTGFEQLVKMQMASDGMYRSMPAEVSREMGALCRVLDAKFEGLRTEADATRRKMNAMHLADHGE